MFNKRLISSTSAVPFNSPVSIRNRIGHLNITPMASKFKPNIPKLCTQLDAVAMLCDIFTFPESDTIANAYEEQVNGTIKLVQDDCERNNFTLPLSEVRVLFTVYCRLGLLCQDLAKRKKSSEWEKERAGYLDQWKFLCSSRDYPSEFEDKFQEYGDIDVQDISNALESLELDVSCSETNVAYTIYWHLCFLCDSLPSGSEKEKWESKRLTYLASEQEQDEQTRAVAFAEQVKAAYKRFGDSERTMNIDKYYNTYLASAEKLRQRATGKQVVLDSLMKKRYGAR
jgi:hypothetical protein